MNKKSMILDDTKVKERTWEEFRESGLFWFINTILYMFGWAITLEVDENFNVKNAYPSSRGGKIFDDEANRRGYLRVAKYLSKNINQIHRGLKKDLK